MNYRRAALIIIDMQQAIYDPRWSAEGPRNNPDAEEHVALLLDAWREAGAFVVHVHHESLSPDSTYFSGGEGVECLPEAEPDEGEMIVLKHSRSAFVNTVLERILRSSAVDGLVVCGVITNNSVEATVRHASDLGFRVVLAEDACFTFARRDQLGRLWSAEEVHAMSLANVAGEYCEIASADVIAGSLKMSANPA